MSQGNGTERNGATAALTPSDVAESPAAGAVASEAPVDELAIVPRLGPTRRKMLSEAGIDTLEALRAVSVDDLGAIKYVGIGNARIIKSWLEEHDSETDSGPAIEANPEAPPAPPELELLPAMHEDSGPQPAGNALRALTELDEPSAETNIGTIDRAVATLKDRLPKKERRSKLGKQLNRIGPSLSGVPQILDELGADERAKAARTLQNLETLLADAQTTDKLGGKKQKSLGTKLKKLRKRLDGLAGK